jgi:hypothetical protein
VRVGAAAVLLVHNCPSPTIRLAHGPLAERTLPGGAPPDLG